MGGEYTPEVILIADFPSNTHFDVDHDKSYSPVSSNVAIEMHVGLPEGTYHFFFLTEFMHCLCGRSMYTQDGSYD